MPNFIIIPNYQKSELKKKFQKRDYSTFSEENYLTDISNSEMLNDINKTNTTSIKYNIFHKHLTDIIDKHAPLRFLNKNEIAIKAKP